MIVATPAGLILQVPPVEASVRVVHAPTHMLVVPPMAAGDGVTVTIVVDEQPPEPNEFVTVIVPDVTPPRIPVVGSIVPTAKLLLLHDPPPDDDVNVIVCPTHTLDDPVIVPGPAFTVTTFVIKQPVEDTV
jgi:hypothetical protein